MSESSQNNDLMKEAATKPKRSRRGANPRSLANLKPIKKGQVLNPGGNPVNRELSKVKALTRDELVEIGTLILKGNMDDLQAEMQDPKCSILKMLVGSVAQRAIQRGDMISFNSLLDRIVGKAADKLEITATRGPQVIVSLPSNGRDQQHASIGAGERPVLDVLAITNGDK